MKSLFPDICSDKLVESRDFYTDLFGFHILFEIDWYIQLASPVDENLQIAFVKKDHSSVPKEHQFLPKGVIITIETEDADTLYTKAKNMQLNITKEICNEEWGQRHFFVIDPNGLIVDVFHMIPPSEEFLKKHNLVESEGV